MKRHRIFKLKIGTRAVGDDVAHVVAIKKALGGRGEVRVNIRRGARRTRSGSRRVLPTRTAV